MTHCLLILFVASAALRYSGRFTTDMRLDPDATASMEALHKSSS